MRNYKCTQILTLTLTYWYSIVYKNKKVTTFILKNPSPYDRRSGI
jgi:hypothetical protein